MEQHVRIKDEQDRGHGAALAEAPGLEVVVGWDIVDKGGVLGVGVESTDQVDQARRHSIVVEDPTEGGVGNAVKVLVKFYVKMGGHGASGDFCRDVEKVVHGSEIRHAPVLAVVHEGMISDESFGGQRRRGGPLACTQCLTGLLGGSLRGRGGFFSCRSNIIGRSSSGVVGAPAGSDLPPERRVSAGGGGGRRADRCWCGRLFLPCAG